MGTHRLTCRTPHFSEVLIGYRLFQYAHCRTFIFYPLSSILLTTCDSVFILATLLGVSRERRCCFCLLAHGFVRCRLMDVCISHGRLPGDRLVKALYGGGVVALLQQGTSEPIERRCV